MTVKRLGGAFGGKGDLSTHQPTAASVAANKLQRPVRLWLPLENCMKMLGKRNQYLFDYKVSTRCLAQDNISHLPGAEIFNSSSGGDQV